MKAVGLVVCVIVASCLVAVNGQGGPNPCIRPCPLIYFPVCGTDGKTYSNKCVLEAASCEVGGKIKVAREGKCANTTEQCERPCPRIYRPVCGTDGKNYSNKCVLDVASCKAGGKIAVAKQGPCKGGPMSCDKPCTRIYKPVCGTDGKTYSNKCVLEVASCKAGKKIKVAHRGPCRGPRVDLCANHNCTNPPNSMCKVKKGKPICTCRFGCPRILKPVCASNGKTYNNECLVKRVACLSKKNIQVVRNGRCGPVSKCRRNCRPPTTCKIIRRREVCVLPKTKNNCPRRCPRPGRNKRQSVCGSDNRTYMSECHMKLHACRRRSTITVKSQGACPGHGRCGFRCRGPRKECKIIDGKPTCVKKGKEKCQKACPRLYRPVCGTDGITYNNKCILDRKACKNRKLRVARWGTCKGDENRRCGNKCRGTPYASCVTVKGKSSCQCPALCPRIVFPVCGTDNKDYPNRCALRRQACLSKKMISIKKPYKCADSRNCMMRCTRILRPVCGSDGKTYSNECVMRSKACRLGKNITVASQGRCPDKCGNKCDNIPYSVCRSGPRNETRCVCPIGCPRNIRPVCGSDGKTYDNFCLLKSNACTTKTMIKVVSGGPCKPDPCQNVTCTSPPFSICQAKKGKAECVCPTMCTMEYNPVCDQDGNNYGNPCGMRVASCQKNKVLKETPCPKPPPQ